MSLPTVRGKLTENEPLGALSWFRCGGDADLLFRPADQEDLISFLQQYPAGEPLMVLGGLANTIIRDGGIRGCVIQFDKAFSEITVEGTKITAQAGAFNGTVASTAAKAGIGGLEFLSGIPGSVGGALRMNAGAYGAEVKDVLVGATAVDRRGNIHELTPDQMGMSYRKTDVPEDYVFTGAVFEGVSEDTDIVRARLKEIKAKRQETQPISEQTGGSTFANPAADELRSAGVSKNMKAWELIDEAGCRDLQIGGARMSKKHCNFMINTGEATAADLESLGDEIIRIVEEKTGVKLHWEIKRVGESA